MGKKALTLTKIVHAAGGKRARKRQVTKGEVEEGSTLLNPKEESSRGERFN